MAKRPKATVTGPRRVVRPPNAAARALSDAAHRPRVAENPKAYSRKGQKKPEIPDEEAE